MKTIKFEKGICINNNYGIFSTMRLGPKWMEKLSTGEIVKIKCIDPDKDARPISEGAEVSSNDVKSYWLDHDKLAQVVGITYGPFGRIVPEDLEFNFDKDCRTILGIEKRMKEIYPDFRPLSAVTNVTLRFL